MEIKRKCDFVETPSGDLYLPRPSSWLGGWARHMWFEHCIGKKPAIASPDLYEELSGRYGECHLVEYKAGVVRVITPEESNREI